MRHVSSLLLAATVAFVVPAWAQEPRSFDVFSTLNTDAVQEGPDHAAAFVTDSPLLVRKIVTYHWAGGRGREPGTIALRSRTGRTYGPWDAESSAGQGGVPDANWLVFPGVVIPAGTYDVIDSDPESWSQNAASGHRGMCLVTGEYSRRRR